MKNPIMFFIVLVFLLFLMPQFYQIWFDPTKYLDIQKTNSKKLDQETGHLIPKKLVDLITFTKKPSLSVCYTRCIYTIGLIILLIGLFFSIYNPYK